MSARRIPAGEEPNHWSRALAAARTAGRDLADLADFDPTHAGLAPLAAAATALTRAGVPAHAAAAAGAAPARAAVAASLAETGADASPGDVVLTTGTSESYGHLFKLLANPGETVLVPAPGYPLLAPLARAEGLECLRYPLRFDGAWHLDRGEFERLAATARAVVLIEPNFPTGACMEPGDRVWLEAVAHAHGLAIVADEVFGDSMRDRARPPPTWIGERQVPTFVLGGLSKRCGLPQLKLGWIVVQGPPAERARARAGLEWLTDLVLSVAAPVQAALPELLALRESFARAAGERVAANLAALGTLAREQPELSVLPVEAGWAAVVRLPARASDEEWALRLLARDVVVHPGHFYDLTPGEYVVASLLVEPATFARGLRALAEVLGDDS